MTFEVPVKSQVRGHSSHCLLVERTSSLLLRKVNPKRNFSTNVTQITFAALNCSFPRFELWLKGNFPLLSDPMAGGSLQYRPCMVRLMRLGQDNEEATVKVGMPASTDVDEVYFTLYSEIMVRRGFPISFLNSKLYLDRSGISFYFSALCGMAFLKSLMNFPMRWC